MKEKIKKHWDSLILGLFLLIIFSVNFVPGTYLAGWDNLLPELNLGMNLKRSFLAAWQEYQGLGLAAGMGHAADLIRQIILLPFVLILPNSWIRYLWHFGMLALGTLGMLTLGKKIFKFQKPIAFLAALFYLLNFGTVQLFWVPYESFTSFWGFFPWLVFAFFQLWEKRSFLNWSVFGLINLLAIPSFYLQTIFFVYLLCLFAFSLVCLVKKPKEIVFFFKSWLMIFLINSFWLLPTTYFLIANRHHPQQALINQMSSQETFLRNQKRGRLQDFVLLRGYYYDFLDRGKPLMAVWQNHFSQKPFLILSYFLGSLGIAGIFLFLFKLLKKGEEKGKEKYLSLLFIFLLSALALLSATPPFSYLNKILRQSSFLNQALRSPFTKFIVPASFSFSLFLGFALKEIGKKINLKITAPLIAVLILISALPVFRGNFIHAKMRVSLPAEYFETFAFFKNQNPTARIVNLPQGGFWGWTFYRWGLRGSGFIWHALEQPVLDRAFDVWNLKNEEYWQDLTYALQNQNLEKLEAVLSKYRVEFVLFDDNIVFPGEIIYAKQALKTKLLLEKSNSLTKVANFGKIDIYRFALKTAPFLTKNQNQPLTLNLNDYRLIAENEENKNLFLPNPIVDHGIQTHFIRCYKTLEGERNKEEIWEDQEQFIRLTAKEDDACAAWWFGSLPLSQGWLVEVIHRHFKGHPLIISAWNEEADLKFFQNITNNYDDWGKSLFIIPPFQSEKQGITVAASNISYNQFESVNEIKSVKLYPLLFEENQKNEIKTETVPLKSKSRIWRYTIEIPSSYQSSSYLALPQAFDPGWLAFYWEGPKPTFLKNHLLINNWANGWELTEGQENTTIHLFFWPQLLQFLGFALLFLGLGLPLFLLKKR